MAIAPPSIALARIVLYAIDQPSRAALAAATAGWARANVREGGIEAATSALASERAPDILVVDLDDVVYAPGALQGLAAVCPRGVRVIAVGAGGSAREVRAVLLEGIEDYQIKPVVPSAVRAAIERVWLSLPVASLDADLSHLRSVVVSGSPGVGVTAVSVALVHALASAGRFAVLLDLGLPVCAAALALDCAPRAGIEELFDHPDSIGARSVGALVVRRGERMLVVGRRATPDPAPPVPAAPVARLVTAFSGQAHWVVVDAGSQARLAQGLSPALAGALRVVEPTPMGLAEAARFALAAPTFAVRSSLVCVMTRVARPLSDSDVEAALGARPAVSFPYASRWPSAVARGTPLDSIPRSFRTAGAALVSHLDRSGFVL